MTVIQPELSHPRVATSSCEKGRTFAVMAQFGIHRSEERRVGKEGRFRAAPQTGRRRHTRCLSDWSSDVCSSDLPELSHPRVATSSCEKGRTFAVMAQFGIH